MSEPLFFDCLTDTQIWSLFDAGVLHDFSLPVEVYQRLERIAPEHGCYLFTWPPGVELPTLQELMPSTMVTGRTSPGPSHSHVLEAPTTAAFMRAAIQARRPPLQSDRELAGGRIYLMATKPHPSVRPGPSLALQVRDLNAMSIPELEAYLDDVLQVDEASISY
jgi:hypothetical protein